MPVREFGEGNHDEVFDRRPIRQVVGNLLLGELLYDSLTKRFKHLATFIAVHDRASRERIQQWIVFMRREKFKLDGTLQRIEMHYEVFERRVIQLTQISQHHTHSERRRCCGLRTRGSHLAASQGIVSPQIIMSLTWNSMCDALTVNDNVLVGTPSIIAARYLSYADENPGVRLF